MVKETNVRDVQKAKSREKVKHTDVAEQEQSLKMKSKDSDEFTTPMQKAEGDDLIYKNENPFKCDMCDYRSATKVSLITQKLVVPKCSLCDDDFNTLNEYEEHVQEHKNEIDEIDVTALTNVLELF